MESTNVGISKVDKWLAGKITNPERGLVYGDSAGGHVLVDAELAETLVADARRYGGLWPSGPVCAPEGGWCECVLYYTENGERVTPGESMYDYMLLTSGENSRWFWLFMATQSVGPVPAFTLLGMYDSAVGAEVPLREL